jgi:putative FmdB family regulatory protein
MPSYNFECLDCKTTETLVATLNEELNIPKCPECNEDMVRKFGIQTIRFMGNGWGKDA